MRIIPITNPINKLSLIDGFTICKPNSSIKDTISDAIMDSTMYNM